MINRLFGSFKLKKFEVVRKIRYLSFMLLLILLLLMSSACGNSESIWDEEPPDNIEIIPDISPTPDVVQYATPDRVVEGTMFFSVGELIDAGEIDLYLAGWWYLSDPRRALHTKRYAKKDSRTPRSDRCEVLAVER